MTAGLRMNSTHSDDRIISSHNDNVDCCRQISATVGFVLLRNVPPPIHSVALHVDSALLLLLPLLLPCLPCSALVAEAVSSGEEEEEKVATEEEEGSVTCTHRVRLFSLLTSAHLDLPTTGAPRRGQERRQLRW